MIDFHTHILFDIDDGASNIIESINILKEYYKVGIRKIVLTPHYIESSDYNASNRVKQGKLKKIKEELKRENLDIDLYLGNEVYISENILELIKTKKISTINNTRYLLLELPFITEDPDALNIIHDLILSNIIPIIAHPERYKYIQDDIKKLELYKEMGALLQINTGSLYGKYGKASKKTVKHIIKNRQADFIATDVHHEKRKVYKPKKLKRKIASYSNKKYANKILNQNQEKVLKDEDI